MFKQIATSVKLVNLLNEVPVRVLCNDVTYNKGLFEKVRRKTNKYNYDVEFLQNCSHESLVGRVLTLQRLVDQYYGMFDSTNFDGRDKVRIAHPSHDELNRNRTNSFRKIAFRVVYLGWHYTAYAWNTESHQKSEPSANVIERVFLEALLRQQLIFRTDKYHQMDRCGRTDRDVSALSQVITVNLQSQVEKGFGVWRRLQYGDDADKIGGKIEDKNMVYFEDGFSNADTSLDAGEIPYVQLLNQALPLDIRVVAWAPVSRTFNARHHCKSRTYRYLFTRGSLDVDLMNEAAQQFVGVHDFRNFGKKTAEIAMKHAIREILAIEIEPLHKSPFDSSNDVCVATIKGKSFVHRQIRLMMSALRLIGLGVVPKSFISELLDVENCPRGVDLSSADPRRLSLVDSEYDDSDIQWRWDQRALTSTAVAMTHNMTDYSSKAALLQHMISELCGKITDDEGMDYVKYHLASSSYTMWNKLELKGEALTVDERNEKSKQRDLKRSFRRGRYDIAARLTEKEPLQNQNVENEDSCKNGNTHTLPGGEVSNNKSS
uniref:tRNA pseudouridine(38/39) synthase n=1 Tax=Phallusia mammillata TaxID=59560 RepID=A0A6F9DQC2_9ASCI|nr:tRNA pseudouridine(38/39) synthase [Phallusia mammillata]